MRTDQELLCIPGKEKNYGLQLDSLVEICTDTPISEFPCLHQNYAGMYNYKGEILPVVRLEEGDEQKEKKQTVSVLIVLRWEKYRFAIAVHEPPFIVAVRDIEKIEAPKQENDGVWAEKGMFKSGELIFSLLDVEQSIERLIIHR